MEGLLREKCIERGLSLPYLGGDVKMRAFLVSVKWTFLCFPPEILQRENTLYLAILNLYASFTVWAFCDLGGIPMLTAM